MKANRGLEIGQRYRTVSSAGVASGPVWVVTKVFRPWHGGFEHVCLESEESQTRSMTFAATVIADKRRFVREE
ncbi:MAG TPA: hypothetical protein VEU47_11460 [Candidatus Cybelea sp.]|nr:hypothetical protein [Candidatus Cybelea sp.]